MADRAASSTSKVSVRRIFSYSIAGVLGLLMTSSLMPPILGNRSERALVNVPVRLLTAPIDGRIERVFVATGSTLGHGETAADIVNREVDRSTLIELDLERVEIEGLLRTKRSAAIAAERQVADLETTIAGHRAALLAALRTDRETARAAIDKAKAAVEIATLSLERRRTLVKRGIYRGGVKDLSEALQAAEADLAMAATLAEAADARLQSADRGVYIGASSGTINGLLVELRAAQRDRREVEAELSKLRERVTEVEKARLRERQRIELLSARSVHGASDMTVLEVIAKRGDSVKAGETFAKAAACEESFVLAIFSERKAQALHAGQRVKIDGEPFSEPVAGIVRSLEPRATLAAERDYAIPFPPAERRELYAVIDFADRTPVFGAGTCQVGAWVNVSLDGFGLPDVRSVATAARTLERKIASFVGFDEASKPAPMRQIAGQDGRTLSSADPFSPLPSPGLGAMFEMSASQGPNADRNGKATLSLDTAKAETPVEWADVDALGALIDLAGETHRRIDPLMVGSIETGTEPKPEAGAAETVTRQKP